MASLRVLAFDHEGRPVQFDTWLDDLQLYLLSDIKDGVSLFDHVSGAATAPPTTAHIEDLVSHLRASDARYRAAVPAEFLDWNQPPMFITLYFIVTRLPDSLRYVRDHFLSLDPTSLTVDLLEQHLLAAETSAVAVGAARGTPRPPFFEGCSPSPLAPSYASAATADVCVAEDVGAASASAKRCSGKGKGGKGGGGGSGSSGGGSSGGGGGGGTGGGNGGSGGGSGGSGGSGGVGRCGTGGGGSGAPSVGSGVGQHQQQQCRSETQSPQIAVFDLDFDAILSAMYASSVSAEGDCYRCVPPDLGMAAAALGASESSTLPGTAPAQALHTFTLDSGASTCFFRHITTLTPLSTPVLVRLDGPFGSPVVACSSTVLPCPAVPSGSLSGLHLPWLSRTWVESVHTRYRASSSSYVCSGVRVRSGSCLLLVSPPVTLDSSVAPPPGSPLPATPLWHALSSSSLWSSQRAAPHSSSFPPTTAPLQTLHMDVWGPAGFNGQSREHYFLLVVDDYTRYTTVFPLRSKGRDLPVLRQHFDRGGEFSSNLLWVFCRGEGILQSFTLPDSPQQNGIAERRIGLVMEVARTSMIHAAAPHFLWPFAVRYAAHQLNLWPRVSLPENSPTLRWTGEVGDASVFRVWGSRSFFRNTSADKLSPRAFPYVFLGFVPDTSGWQFYHPTLRHVFPSQDVTFDESVPFYRLFPYRSTPPLPPPLFLAPGPLPVDPLPPQGPAPSGVSKVDPLPGPAPVQVAVDSGAARGAVSGGAASGGAEPGGAESEGSVTGGAEPGGVETGGAAHGCAEPEGVEPGGFEPEGAEPEGAASEGAESGGAESQGVASSGGYAGSSPRLSPQHLREWFIQCAHPQTRAARAGGAGVAAGAGVTGGTATTGTGGARTHGTGAAGAGGAGGTSVGGTGAGGAGVGDTGVGGAGAVALGGAVRPRPPSRRCCRPLHCLLPLFAERHEPASHPVLPIRTARRVPHSHPPPVPGTHAMALRPSSVPLRVPQPAPPESSLPEAPDPESDHARAANPTVSCLLATAVTDPSFKSAAASALVAELLDFAAACCLDYASALKDFECLAAAVPRFASMLLAPEGDPDAPDLPTPRSYAEAITGPYSSQWQAAMDAKMASWKSTGTYVNEVPPPVANIVDGMWIFRVKRPPGSPPAFKARYVSRGFSQRQGVDYFHTFSLTPRMTNLRVLLHVAAQRDYELHFLDFTTAFLLGSLHEEIWLRRPPGFTKSLPKDYTCGSWVCSCYCWPVAVLRTDTSLPPFYVLVYVDDLVFATAYTEALTLVNLELHKRYTCTDLGELRSYLGLQITRDSARRTITLTELHMVHHVLQHFGFQFSSPQPTPLSTSHWLSAPPLDESVEPSGPYPELVGCLMYLMTCTRPDPAYPFSLLARYVAPGRHRKVHWDAAKRVLHYLCSTSGMGLVLGGGGPVVLTGRADASWELRWLTYLLTNLGEQPRSPLVLYVENKAMIALCQEHRLEHQTKHIALRYFLARELQQRSQLRLAYVATRANTADIITKALPPACFSFLTGLGRMIRFDAWLDDFQLYLQSDSRDSVLLFHHTSGASLAPPATADSATRSQWLTRDAAARLAIRNHLPLAECAHFGQHKTAKALYDVVVSRYSSSATAALGHLKLPYLFPELSAFATVEELVSHLRTSDTRYCAALPAEFLDRNPPPMYITLYFIAIRLPDFLHAVKDQCLSLDPTDLTVDLLEQHLLAAETSVVAVGAACGTPRTPFFEGCSPFPLAPSYASSAAVDVFGAKESGLLLLVGSAAAARARVAGVVEVVAGVVVGAAQEVVEAVEVVVVVGVVAGVGALVGCTNTELEGVEPGGAKSECAESGGAEPWSTASSGGPAGFSQRQGVDYFQTFSPTPKMTTLWMLLHVAAQRDNELHSLDFSTAFLHNSLHEEIRLRRPPGFTGSFLPGLHLRLWIFLLRLLTRRCFYASTRRCVVLRPRVLQCFGFQFSSPQPTPLSTSHSFSDPPSDESVKPSGPYPELVGCIMYLMTCTRPDLAYPLSLLARYVAPGRHQKRSSQGYTFSLGSGSVSWRSSHSSSVLSSSCEAEIYAGAMAAQELCWLTYVLTDLGAQHCSPPNLYVDNKTMIALCQEHRLEHRKKHIALQYFLA
ncbi:unnamed protein product [Closterium sp. NIES-53]